MGQVSPRICRAIFSYPTSSYPGAGLAAYYLSQYIPVNTLLLARHLPGNKRSIGPHVTVKRFRFPNPSLSGVHPLRWRLWKVIGKLCGMTLFTFRAIPLVVWYRPQILHIHTHLPLPLAVIGKVIKAKVIVTFHGTDVLAVRRSRFLQLLCRIFAKEVWYVSKAMQDPLRSMFPKVKMLYTPNGVDPSYFHPTGSERKLQIVCVGSLKWQKGFPVLLQAFKRVMEQLPNYSLVIIGDGEERDSLISLTRQLKLEKHVNFKGQCSHEEIAKTLNESALFVLSSVSEGFPKVLVEALSCGLPLVVTDVGDCGGLVRENEVGIVVPSDNPTALAEAVVEVLRNKRLYGMCAEHTEPTARKYDWATVTQSVFDEYKRLLVGQ